MCGICGLVSRDGHADTAAVQEMTATLVHRGPDHGGIVSLGACALGHRRLRVIDLESGDQPVRNETGTVTAVFNGELYDFCALRAELTAAGHAVPGTGDTPVVPHAYEEWGPGFAARLHGMFALALWDAERERLVLARDRIGKKPLLYVELPDGTLAFASELKALLRLARLPRQPDCAAIDAYLALQYVPGDGTILSGVRKVPPGHVLVRERGHTRLTRYWTLEPTGESLDEAEWLERVRETVRGAVRRRLVSDVPLGALLSGGIDSTVVVGLAAEASSTPLRTFTVGFANQPRYDERGSARIAASAFGTVHEEIVLEPDPVELVTRLGWLLDEPLGDEAILPQLLISEAARRHVTVALTGDGGDESFAGYERYAAVGLARRLGAVPVLPQLASRTLRLLPAGRREPRSTAFRLARLLAASACDTRTAYGSLVEIFPVSMRLELYSRELLDALNAPAAAADLLGPLPAPGVAGLQRLDTATYLPGDLLLKADLASMGVSLEVRSPLLDHEVLTLGISLPDSLRFDGRTGKVALRRAFADIVPPTLLARGKTGFGVPIGEWLRGPLRELAGDVLLDPVARDRDRFRPDGITRLLKQHWTGERDHAHRIWCLLVLELWQRTYLDSSLPPQRPGTVPVAARA
jgi:asparagine synthase (glutamine-hydrolysing)